MSELQNVMERFRVALKSVQDRIDEAEARPTRDEVEKLKASRVADLQEFEKLKAELERLQKGQ